MGIVNRIQAALKAFAAPSSAAEPTRSFPVSGSYIGGLIGRNDNIVNSKVGMALAQTVNVSVYRAIHARMTAVAGLAWVLKNRDTGEVVLRSEDGDMNSPLARAFASESRALGADFFGMWQMAKCVSGEAYFQLVRNDAGFAHAIQYLNPMLTEPIAPLGRIEGYRYQGAGGSVVLDVDEVVYDRYRSVYDDVRGLSPLSVALDAVNVERDTVRFFGAFFRNNASLGKIVTPRDGMTANDFERFKSEFREQLVGVDNAFRTLLSSHPVDMLTVPTPDMDKPLPLLDYIQRQILVSFGVMRTVAGDTDGSRYQASPQDLNWFYLNTIIPEARQIAAVVNRDFVPFFYGNRPSVVFEFDVSEWSAVSDGERYRTEQTVALHQAGIITLNEARRALGYDDIEGADVVVTQDDGAELMTEDALAAQAEATEAEAEAEAEDTVERKLAELRAWQAFHKRGRTREFRVQWLDALEASAVRALLPASYAWSAVRDIVAGKSFETLAQRMSRRLVLVWRENEGSDALFMAAFRDVLREFGTSAYVTGLREVGARRELSESDKARVAAWVDEQMGYAAGVLDDIRSGVLTRERYQERADLWANNSLSDVYHLAMRNANTDENPLLIPLLLLGARQPNEVTEQTVTVGERSYVVKVDGEDVSYRGKRVGRVVGNQIRIDEDAVVYEWRLGIAEHCSTCLMLSGQRHTMAEWVASGWLPQSRELECRGYRCKCSLHPILGAEKRGNFAPKPTRASDGSRIRLPDGAKVKAASRYSHIDFTPTDGMVEEAKRGLEWREQYGRGGTAVGVARARDIVNRRRLSPQTVRRMKAYFDRHEVDKQGEGFTPDEDGFPSAGRIAWALWGGDAGQAWANARVRQMEAADEQSG